MERWINISSRANRSCQAKRSVPGSINFSNNYLKLQACVITVALMPFLKAICGDRWSRNLYIWLERRSFTAVRSQLKSKSQRQNPSVSWIYTGEQMCWTLSLKWKFCSSFYFNTSFSFSTPHFYKINHNFKLIALYCLKIFKLQCWQHQLKYKICLKEKWKEKHETDRAGMDRGNLQWNSC